MAELMSICVVTSPEESPQAADSEVDGDAVNLISVIYTRACTVPKCKPPPTASFSLNNDKTTAGSSPAGCGAGLPATFDGTSGKAAAAAESGVGCRTAGGVGDGAVSDSSPEI